MVKLIRSGVYYAEGKIIKEAHAFMTSDKKAKAIENSVAYSVLKSHGKSAGDTLKLKFDELISHGDACVSVVQTAEAVGAKSFSVPYTIMGQAAFCAAENVSDEDLRRFALSAAKKYGGNYVPAKLAAGNRYLCERIAKCGEMILSSENDACGALGAMAVAEEGHAFVKQLMGQTCDIDRPEIIAVYLKGKLRKGVGPTDVALSLLGAAYKSGFLAGKILEFIGPGAAHLSMEYRMEIDAAIVLTQRLSTVWETDEKTLEFLRAHGREGDYRQFKAVQPAYYDGAVTIDLTRVEPMIAFSSRIAEVYTLNEFLSRPEEILRTVEEGKGSEWLNKIKDGKVVADRAVIGGCAGGGYETIAEAAEILRGKKIGAFSLEVYPASQPIYKKLISYGYYPALTESGADGKAEICAPRIGEDGSFVLCNNVCCGNKTAAFMDARSIAATAANGGALTSALGLEYTRRVRKYKFDGRAYKSGVYCGALAPDKTAELVRGASVKELPCPNAPGKHLFLEVCEGDGSVSESVAPAASALKGIELQEGTQSGKVVAAIRAGDELLPERAAARLCSAGVVATVCKEYASERYIQALVGMGIVPFRCEKPDFKAGDRIYIADIAEYIANGETRIMAKVISKRKTRDVVLYLPELAKEERAVLLAGGFVNYHKNGSKTCR